MSLQREPPLGVRLAIGDGCHRVLALAGPVHRLQEEVGEGEAAKITRIDPLLRENELQLVAGPLDELRAGLDVAVMPFELRFGEPMLWPHGLAVLLPMAVAALWAAVARRRRAGQVVGGRRVARVLRRAGLGVGTAVVVLVLALLVAGIAAPTIGGWIDRYGGHVVMAAGSLTGALAVALPFFAATWLLSDGQMPTHIPERAAAAIVYLGLFGSVVGFVLYYYMIKHMEAAQVALIPLVTPVLALLLGHALNAEPIPLNVWLGTASIMLGLSLHQWGEHSRRQIARIP